MKISPIVPKVLLCGLLAIAGVSGLAQMQEASFAGTAAPAAPPMPDIPSPGKVPEAAKPAAAASTSPFYLVPHKALYDMRMVAVSSGAGLTDIRGNMMYEQDDACDAWTTDHRFTIEYSYPERPSVVNSTHYVSWEAKDQSLFQFSSERQENGVPSEQLRGSVQREADTEATAEFSRPENLYFELPKGYVLPSHHTQEVLRAAQAGRKTYHAVLFDGTDKEGPVEVNAVILRKLTTDEILKQAAPGKGKDTKGLKFDRDLLSGDAWLVRMAVFPMLDNDSMSPTYEMDLALHDNGVVSHVVVDYKSFKVEQILTAIQPLERKACP